MTNVYKSLLDLILYLYNARSLKAPDGDFAYLFLIKRSNDLPIFLALTAHH